MEKYILNLQDPFSNTVVDVNHKNIKNVNLKVCRDYRVLLSVPFGITDEWIINFIEDKASWIEKQLQKYKQASGYNTLTDIKSGTSTQMLGKDYVIIKKKSEKNYVVEQEKKIVLYVKDIDDKVLHQKIIEKWWRDKAYDIYINQMNIIYDKTFKKYGVEKPKLYVRKMKTLWGSCTPAKNKITLNEYLLKADLRCIQYVILHELTHLLYAYHNNDFYDFLTIQMPDWKIIKKQLDTEVVQGL